MRQTHRLKLRDTFFEDVAIGTKPFEVRRDDRGYQVGDILHLVEVDAAALPTGRECWKVVTCVLRHEDFREGVRRGYAVLGLRGTIPPFSEIAVEIVEAVKEQLQKLSRRKRVFV